MPDPTDQPTRPSACVAKDPPGRRDKQCKPDVRRRLARARPLPEHTVDSLRRAVAGKRPPTDRDSQGRQGTWTAEQLARHVSTERRKVNVAEVRSVIAEWKASPEDAPPLHRLKSIGVPAMASAVLSEELLNWSLLGVDELAELVEGLATLPSLIQSASQALGIRSTIYRRLKDLEAARAKDQADRLDTSKALATAAAYRNRLRDQLLANPPTNDIFTAPGVWSIRIIPVDLYSVTWREATGTGEATPDKSSLVAFAMDLRTGAYLIELLSGLQRKTRSAFLSTRLSEELGTRGGTLHLPQNCQDLSQPLAYRGLIAEGKRLGVQVRYDMPRHLSPLALPVFWCPSEVDPRQPVSRSNRRERPSRCPDFRSAKPKKWEAQLGLDANAGLVEAFAPCRTSPPRGRPVKTAP